MVREPEKIKKTAMVELVEWFRWKLRRKKKKIQERSSIPDIRVIKVSGNISKQFTTVQDTLRKTFPGLADKDWRKKI